MPRTIVSEFMEGACPFLIMQYPQAMQIVRNVQAAWWGAIEGDEQLTETTKVMSSMYMLKGVSYPQPRFSINLRCQASGTEAHQQAMLVAGLHSKELTIELFDKLNALIVYGTYRHYRGRPPVAAAAGQTWQVAINEWQINVTDFLERDRKQYQKSDTPQLRQIQLETSQ